MFRKILYDGVLAINRTGMYDVLHELEESQYSTPEALSLIQANRLASIVNYARINCEFYRGLPELRPEDSLKVVQSLPMLTKQCLINNPRGLQPGAQNRSTFSKTTGGSTGEPVTVLKDRRAFGSEIAAAWRGLAWAGIRPGMRQARFWGVPSTRKGAAKARIIDFIGNRLRISAFAFDDEKFDEAIRALNRFRPDYFYGYVSILREFATFMKVNHRDFEFRPSAVITTAEVLDTATRLLLEDVFGAKVFQEYGCGELGTIAHECESGALHINAENLFVEQGPMIAGSDSLRELIITDLRNKAMPLIRYRVGDLGELSHHNCACGRGLPVLQSICGRAYDVLVNGDGKRFHPEFFIYIFEDAKNAGMHCPGFQLEQTGRNELTIRMLGPIPEQERLEKYIMGRLVREFYPTVKVVFQQVATLQREASGKMRVVKSSIN